MIYQSSWSDALAPKFYNQFNKIKINNYQTLNSNLLNKRTPRKSKLKLSSVCNSSLTILSVRLITLCWIVGLKLLAMLVSLTECKRLKEAHKTTIRCRPWLVFWCTRNPQISKQQAASWTLSPQFNSIKSSSSRGQTWPSVDKPSLRVLRSKPLCKVSNVRG